jgi:uncharacterized glyoxalase superfamily protein PhnB
VQDVDAPYETYKKEGAIIRTPPADYPWGVREKTVEDLAAAKEVDEYLVGRHP